MQLTRLIIDLRNSKNLEITHIEVCVRGIYYLIPTYFDISDNYMRKQRFFSFEHKVVPYQHLNFRSFSDSDFYKIGRQLVKL